MDKLRDWKKEFGFNDVISNLSSRIVGADLGNLELLSPEAEDHLRKLAESKVADLDFSRYTDVFDAQVLNHQSWLNLNAMQRRPFLSTI